VKGLNWVAHTTRGSEWNKRATSHEMVIISASPLVCRCASALEQRRRNPIRFLLSLKSRGLSAVVKKADRNLDGYPSVLWCYDCRRYWRRSFRSSRLCRAHILWKQRRLMHPSIIDHHRHACWTILRYLQNTDVYFFPADLRLQFLLTENLKLQLRTIWNLTSSLC